MYSLRKTFADAIRRCELAEQQAKQAQEAAARQRQTALSDARQNHAQARQAAEAVLKEVRNLAQQGDRILADLGLAPASLTPYAAPSGVGLDELLRLLQNQRSQARDALNRLKASADALREERRKWWKFW